MNKFQFQLFSIALVTFLFGCTTSKMNQKMDKKISGIVVFGDGLSDMGRWGKITDFRYPPADLGFLESRWTNGKVWVEHFAEGLGLPISLENNYAMGGATTGYYNINEGLRAALKAGNKVAFQGMLAQVEAHLAKHPKLDDKTLFTLWAGGHDIGSYLDYGQPDLAQYPPAGNYRMAIEKLVQAGAKNILIGTMPDMGYTPVYFGTKHQAEASRLCAELNNGLDKIIESYKGRDIRFIKIDGAAIFSEVGMSPARYGFKTTEAYLPFTAINFADPLAKNEVVIPNKEKGLNPDDFMNWWAVSASAKMHQILAEKALEAYKKQVLTAGRQ